MSAQVSRGTDTAPQVEGCVSGPDGKRETGDDDQSWLWLWPGAKVQTHCKLISGDKKQPGHQAVGRCNTLAIFKLLYIIPLSAWLRRTFSFYTLNLISSCPGKL